MNSRLHHIQTWPELAKQTNWTVAGLAKECGVSVRTLEVYFLRNFGESPKMWLLKQRQSQSPTLLSEGHSVKETAAMLRYKHPQHFSRDFKSRFGHCPTQAMRFLQSDALRRLV